MEIRDQSIHDLVGINERNLHWVHEYNHRKFFPQVDDKIKTKELLHQAGIPTPKTLGIIDSYVNLEETLDSISQNNSIVVKPSKGKAGGGILLLEKGSVEQWVSPSGKSVSREDLIFHIGEILFGVYSFGTNDDRALFEKKIIPHEFFLDLYGHGIADIRIIYFKQNPIMAMLRVPTSASEGKANLHQGAIGIGLDLKTGNLTHASKGGYTVAVHPDSKLPFDGLCIPQWSDVLEISQAASGCVDLDYLGIDLVIDEEDGPLVLELNARPGLEIQVVNKNCLGRLLRRFV